VTPTARSIFLSSAAPCTENESRFFAAIRTSDGVFKTTDRQRMGDLNSSLASWCKTRGMISIDLLDVAASSGVSTSDLHQDLLERGIQARVTAADILIDGRLLRLFPGCYALVDIRNKVLQHDLFGIAIRPYYSNKLTHYLVSLCANLIHRVLSSATAPFLVKCVKLVSRSAENIRFVQDDLFENNDQLNGCFNIVRAANILNEGYFERDRIQIAVRNLTRRLKGAGSLLIVNRTLEDGTNHGSVFELTEEGAYHVVCRVGTGSEVEDCVLSYAEADSPYERAT
jgi:hypothetical protein